MKTLIEKDGILLMKIIINGVYRQKQWSQQRKKVKVYKTVQTV